jgi:hypothetical protein
MSRIFGSKREDVIGQMKDLHGLYTCKCNLGY